MRRRKRVIGRANRAIAIQEIGVREPDRLARRASPGTIDAMSPSALRQRIGQLLIGGFDGHQVPPELRSLAKEFSLGGVILFARNVAEPEQVAAPHPVLPLAEHPPERLRETEFVPFKAAIEAGVATIMTAHVFVPALDEDKPATLSRRIVTGILRNELKYPGAILSDDLEMK